jgi:hypothetical protein
MVTEDDYFGANSVQQKKLTQPNGANTLQQRASGEI